jgi:hypothetical protein
MHMHMQPARHAHAHVHVNMDMCMRHAPCDTLCMCMHMHMLMHMHTHAHAHVHVVACLPVRAPAAGERESLSLLPGIGKGETHKVAQYFLCRKFRASVLRRLEASSGELANTIETCHARSVRDNRQKARHTGRA